MARKLVTEAGYYDGQFLKPGQHYGSDDDATTGSGEVSEKLTKEELLAIAAERGIEIDSGKTKAEIVAAINGAAA